VSSCHISRFGWKIRLTPGGWTNDEEGGMSADHTYGIMSQGESRQLTIVSKSFDGAQLCGRPPGESLLGLEKMPSGFFFRTR